MLRQLALTSLALALLVTPAAAETVLTPFAGVAYGGATDRSRPAYGGSIAFIGGTSGFEIELGVVPEFFGDESSSALFNENNVVSAMGSFMLVFPAGGARIYGVAGGGLLRTRLEVLSSLFDASSNDFGIDVGGGILLDLSPSLGLRGDVRYFRSLSDISIGDLDLDIGSVDYWRITGGLTLRF
jgi:opacity protein-like surface antigen